MKNKKEYDRIRYQKIKSNPKKLIKHKNLQRKYKLTDSYKTYMRAYMKTYQQKRRV